MQFDRIIMASREQYEFFKFLYEEEDRRSKELETRAQFYFAVISAFLATLLFNAAGIRNDISTLGIAPDMIIVETALLMGSLLLVVIAMMIRKHQRIAAGNDMLSRFGNTPLSEEAFFTMCIGDYNKAIQYNRKKNAKAASYLLWGSILLVTSMIVLLLTLAFSTYS